MALVGHGLWAIPADENGWPERHTSAFGAKGEVSVFK